MIQQVEEQINQGGHDEGTRSKLENQMQALRARLCCLTGQSKIAGAMDYVRQNIFPGGDFNGGRDDDQVGKTLPLWIFVCSIFLPSNRYFSDRSMRMKGSAMTCLSGHYLAEVEI